MNVKIILTLLEEMNYRGAKKKKKGRNESVTRLLPITEARNNGVLDICVRNGVDETSFQVVF